jgi:hypothetical protein
MLLYSQKLIKAVYSSLQIGITTTARTHTTTFSNYRHQSSLPKQQSDPSEPKKTSHQPSTAANMIAKTAIAATVLLAQAAFGAPSADVEARQLIFCGGDDSKCPAGEVCNPILIDNVPVNSVCGPPVRVEARQDITFCSGANSQCPAGQTCHPILIDGIPVNWVCG